MLELRNIETLARSAAVITGTKTKGRKQTRCKCTQEAGARPTATKLSKKDKIFENKMIVKYSLLIASLGLSSLAVATYMEFAEQYYNADHKYVIEHSGRTDSSGGHNCSDKSKRNGLCFGYPYHR